MKNTFILLIISLYLFGCTKDNNLIIGDKTYTDELGLHTYDGFGGSSGGGGNGEGDTIQIEAGQITAGEWKDLENWDFWTSLCNEQEFDSMDNYWEYNLNERISVKVRNSAGDLLENIKIELRDSDNNILWTAKSDNSGSAELWPGLSADYQYNEDLILSVDGTIQTSVLEFQNGVNEIILNKTDGIGTKKIEIAFMVDATGSMGDELEYLKVELIDVIKMVEQNHTGIDVNLGAVFYRDEGDEYLTKKSDLTSDYTTTTSFIAKQRADGGGDYPEAVHSALKVSVNNLQWSDQAYSRILFMVLDAPPHYDAQVIDEIHLQTKKAAAAGIKLIPITASGIDKETEFLMRYMAMATNGSYVFVTNHSGIGNDHITPSIGQYDLEYLNELLVRLIGEYLE
ncbi:MAG: VWA domain-containing protein [Bacteroidales bacterium]|nr:VWA domain-containing protein [Bacteroidales bacterium]MCF8390701.1 VWA domain-containing protein [Bacteroidales bacterium]